MALYRLHAGQLQAWDDSSPWPHEHHWVGRGPYRRMTHNGVRFAHHTELGYFRPYRQNHSSEVLARHVAFSADQLAVYCAGFAG